MNPNFRNFALWVVIFLLVLALVTLFQNPGHRGGGSEIAYSQLLNDADAGKIQSVTISGQDVSGTYVGGGNFSSYAPNDPGLVSKLQGKGVQITARPPSRELAADPRVHRRLDLPLAPDAVRRWPRHGLRQVEGQAPQRSAWARLVR
jgi:hypothetical protein